MSVDVDEHEEGRRVARVLVEDELVEIERVRDERRDGQEGRRRQEERAADEADLAATHRDHLPFGRAGPIALRARRLSQSSARGAGVGNQQAR